MQEYRKTIPLPEDREYHYVEMGGDVGQGGYSRHAFPTLAAAQLFAGNHQGMRPGRTILVDGVLYVEDGHVVTVGWVADNHGYPYRATCSCGEWQSNTYAAAHAAQAMGDDHLAAVTGDVTP